ncbi:MAG: hypothetical protein ACI9DK_001553 [Vicingaceae bacterium]
MTENNFLETTRKWQQPLESNAIDKIEVLDKELKEAELQELMIEKTLKQLALH